MVDGPFTVWGPREPAHLDMLVPTPVDPATQKIVDTLKKTIAEYLEKVDKSMFIPFFPTAMAIGGAFDGYITGPTYQVVAFKIDKRNRLWLTGRNINNPQDMQVSREHSRAFAAHRPRRHLKRRARTHIGHLIVTLRPQKPADHIDVKVEHINPFDGSWVADARL